MRHLKTTLAVLGAATILVLAGNTISMATTGHAILAGKINTANKMTSIVRTTSGTGLQVKTKSTANSPFAVNGKGKVVNLNADAVDGLDSSALKTSAYVFTKAVTVGTTSIDMPITLPAGNYLMGYAAYMIGGGTDGGGAGCYFRRALAGNFTYFGETRIATLAAVIPSVSGNGIINIGPGVTLDLHCFTPANFTTSGNEPIQITAVRTSIIGGGSLRVASGARVAH